MDMETHEIEDGLLLRCLGIGTDEIKVDRLEQLSPAGWDELICRADMHSVAPLLFHRFRVANVDTRIPVEVMQELREIYLATSWENSERYCELLRVLKALHDRRVQVIIMKGAALAVSIYPSIALRPMCDIDILVRDSDVCKADEVLSQLGYESSISSPLSKRCLQHIRHIGYAKDHSNIQIHPKLPELPDLDPWINASPAEKDLAGAFVLGVEDFFLHLCLHLNCHLSKGGLTELIRWYDILEFLKCYGDDFDWDHIVRTARENKVEGIIHGVLRAVSEWIPDGVHAEAINQFSDSGVTMSISDASLTDIKHPRELSSLLFALRGPIAHNRFRHVFRAVFPYKSLIINHYSIKRPGYVYFYYFVRVAEVAMKAIRAACQLLGYLRMRNT